MSKKWMLYGANGYTGELTAKLAKEKGYSPILAGRNAEAVEALAAELNFDCRVFDLTNAKNNVKDVEAVVHMAGPFSKTYLPMLEACLANKVHYLDVTGEISVFEGVFRHDLQAQKAGVCLLPGVGFDVVPTDCLAATLAKKLPGATKLELAFVARGGQSKGTVKTMIEGMPSGGCVRRNGVLTQPTPAETTREVKFPKGTYKMMSIPWGDVSTAFYSTKIPNITAYTRMSNSQSSVMGLLGKVRPLLSSKLVQKGLHLLVDKFVEGPSEEARAKGYCLVWGQVEDASGKIIQGSLTTPEGYTFSARSSLNAVSCLLDKGLSPGAKTPSMAFGADFVMTIDGVKDLVFY